MDSDDELPALVPLDNLERSHTAHEDEVPAIIPIFERRHFLLPPRTHDFSEDFDEMPTLMSVSDSSDDADVSSFHYSSEGDEGSGWTDDEEVTEDFDEDLPSLPPTREVAPDPSDEETDEEDIPPPEYPSRYSHILPFLNDNSWLPPHRPARTRGTGIIPEGLLDALTLRINPGIGIPEDPPTALEPDLDRATLLVSGLERVSGGLLERMLRVGGAPGAYVDVSNEAKGVSGCAICWESLLDQNVSEAEPTHDALPFPPEEEEIDIVCLPCAHVFHSSCLITWFSHKTSCPTCRFNIDPDSLTQRPWHQIYNIQQHSATLHRQDIILNNIYGETVIDDGVLGLDDQLSDSDFEFDVPMYDEWPDVDHTHLVHHAAPSTNRPWTLPDAPGKSLRESIEEKEREMGLRCLDPICLFAPTDEAPHTTTPFISPQISIKVPTVTVCTHAVHPACLVRSARVAGWEPVTSDTVDARDSDFSAAEVLCPSCLTTGTVTRKDWEEGITALAKNDP